MELHPLFHSLSAPFALANAMSRSGDNGIRASTEKRKKPPINNSIVRESVAPTSKGAPDCTGAIGDVLMGRSSPFLAFALWVRKTNSAIWPARLALAALLAALPHQRQQRSGIFGRHRG